MVYKYSSGQPYTWAIIYSYAMKAAGHGHVRYYLLFIAML